MSKISFYQVMNGEIIKFSCQLLEKCFQNNIITFVQVSDDATKELIDRTLWTFSQKSFIPHATDNDPLPEKQPIYISTRDECPIKAKGLMMIGVDRLDIKDFERVMVMFDGNVRDDAKRCDALMTSFKNLGHDVEYYAQNEKGGWVLKF